MMHGRREKGSALARAWDELCRMDPKHGTDLEESAFADSAEQQSPTRVFVRLV